MLKFNIWAFEENSWTIGLGQESDLSLTSSKVQQDINKVTQCWIILIFHLQKKWVQPSWDKRYRHIHIKFQTYLFRSCKIFYCIILPVSNLSEILFRVENAFFPQLFLLSRFIVFEIIINNLYSAHNILLNAWYKNQRGNNLNLNTRKALKHLWEEMPILLTFFNCRRPFRLLAYLYNTTRY